MAENEAPTEEMVFDLSKMKMAELKAELGARGLKTSGKKAELIDRLQTYMEEHEDAEVEDPEDEDALLLDETAEADALNEASKPQEEEAAETVEEPETAVTDDDATAANDDELVADDVDMEAESVAPPAEKMEENETAAPTENTVEDDILEDEKDDLVEELPAKKMEENETAAPTENTMEDDILEDEKDDLVEKTEGVPSAETPAPAEEDDLLLISDDKEGEKEVEEVAITKKIMPRIEFPAKEEEKPKADSDSTEKKKLSEAERIEKRKQRFGNIATTNGKDSTPKDKKEEGGAENKSSKPKVGKLSKDGAEIDPDKLKKRAERFGSTVSSTLVKTQQQEAIEKRKRRFGGGDTNGDANSTSAAVATTDSEAEAKKAKRAERFQAATAATA